jgi:hydrogenase maturation protease
MMEKKKLVILGLGNVLMKDEGFGVHFLRWFLERHRLPETVEAVDGGTLGYVLLDLFDRCERMVVIDTIKLDDPPGSVYRFTREEMALYLPPPTTAHEVSFSDVLCKAEMAGELPEIVFLCIIPRDWQDMGLEMTGELEGRLPVVEELLLAELEALGIPVEPARDA